MHGVPAGAGLLGSRFAIQFRISDMCHNAGTGLFHNMDINYVDMFVSVWQFGHLYPYLRGEYHAVSSIGNS